MTNFNDFRHFRLGPGGIECDADGLRVGEVQLLARGSRGGWASRDEAEINSALSRICGFPLDIARKRRGFDAVAAALHLQLPRSSSDPGGGPRWSRRSAPYDFRKSSYADTYCHIGSSGLPTSANLNLIFMRLSELRPSTGRPWRASELRPMMRFAREIWNPVEMCALFSFYTLDLPEIPDPTWAAGKRSLKPWIGWITYLPPDLAARAKYPGDVEVETFEDGAALVTLCEEPFEKANREGMARLHALEAALRPLQS